VMADAAGELSHVNRADDRLWGMPSASERNENERRTLARSLWCGEVVEKQHLDIRCADGKTKTIRASSAPLRDDSGAIVGAVGVNVDVTEEVRELAEARAAARAREEIVGMVSHDLKDPLGVIAGSALAIERSLAHGGKDEAIARRKVEVIHRAVQRMDRLITDLLDLARIDGCKLPITAREESASDLLEQAVEAALPIAQAKHIELRSEGEGGKVACDRARVLQVFANLVGNAMKLTPDHGTVTLTARPAGSKTWEFSVRDTGPGIPPDHLPFLFDRFWKGNNGAHGVGLGLAIAKGIVEAHGGEIRAESPAGGGALFTFTLPAG